MKAAARGRRSARRFVGATAAALIAAAALLVAPAMAGAQVAAHPAPGATAQSLFAAPGPYDVASTATVSPCVWPLGQRPADYAELVGTVIDAQCSGAFPYGSSSPVGVHLYYPEGAAPDQRFPALVWSPGTITDPGMYDAAARLWASHGIVVAVPYDFINSQPDVPLLGVAALVHANRDPSSPLHGRVDLGRTALGGHSAGGAASLRAQPILTQPILNQPLPGPLSPVLDPGLRVVSLLAVEPAPGATGSTVTVPALVLTGEDDAVIPARGYPKTEQFDEMRSAPAFFAIARGATHVTPIAPVADNAFAGATTAWLLYTLMGDEAAARFFVGAHWLLAADPDFTGAERNSQAAALGG